MYTLGELLLLALVLGAALSVVDSVLNTIGIGDTIKKIPVIGANWSLLISIGLVWWFKLDPMHGWVDMGLEDAWMQHVANGAIILGMIPVKDAVISMVNKGLRA
jgi:hypothetical protein